MKLQKTLDRFLLQLHPKKIDLSRDRIYQLLSKLGNPQNQLKNVITVNDTIAQLYSDEYGVSVQTIRNLPISISESKKSLIPSRKSLGLPPTH